MGNGTGRQWIEALISIAPSTIVALVILGQCNPGQGVKLAGRGYVSHEITKTNYRTFKMLENPSTFGNSLWTHLSEKSFHSSVATMYIEG